MNYLRNQKSDQIAALVSCAAAVISAFLPLMRAADPVETFFVSTVRGVNLMEFSGFGAIAGIAPWLFLANLLCGLDCRQKTLLHFALTVLCAFSLPEALRAAAGWLAENVNPLIEREAGFGIYLALLGLSAVLTMIAIQRQDQPSSAD